MPQKPPIGGGWKGKMKQQKKTPAAHSGGKNTGAETPRRAGTARKSVLVKTVKRTWLRTGSGTRLLSEEVVEERRDSKGRVVGGEKPRMIPRSRLGGRGIFRACEFAASRVCAGIERTWAGGAR